ncbi:hypothetical protein [Lacunimicrobium album]
MSNDHGRFLFLILVAFVGSLNAQPPQLLPADSENGPTLLEQMHQPNAGQVSPVEDDATLRHVIMVSSTDAFALGDLGQVLKTTDGGANWKKVDIPATAHYRTACFLSDKFGWIAGGKTIPFAKSTEAALLVTKDGGETWTPIDVSTWPEFISLKFFDLENAIAVTLPTPAVASGVLRTVDGGKTWMPLEGTANAVWQAGTFIDSETGVLVGTNATIRLVAGAQLGPELPASNNPKHLRDALVLPSGKGVFVGDGALMLRTTSAGVTTQQMSLPVPRSSAQSLSFRAVEIVEGVIYLAGQPGSVVWRSEDGGKSWTSAPTPLVGTIHDLDFITPDHGIAVGDLGQIVMTKDGGKSWTPCRNEGYHLAALSLFTRPEQFPFLTVARYGANDGYRVGTVLLTTGDARDPQSGLPDQHSLHAATVSDGGRVSHAEWMLPAELPDGDLDWQKLAIWWNEKTDGHLQEDVVSRFVLLLRMMQPEIVTIPTGKSDQNLAPGAFDRLLHDALVRAVVDAANPAAYPDQLTMLHLKPHRVERVFQKLPSSQMSRPCVEPFELLGNLKKTAAAAAHDSLGLVAVRGNKSSLAMPEVVVESYAVIETDTEGLVRQYADLFAGILIPPGSLSRRTVTTTDVENLKPLLKAAERQRNAYHLFRQRINAEQSAAYILAEFDELTRGLTDEESAMLLFELARKQVQTGHMLEAQSTIAELARRYGKTNAAGEAFTWIIQTASSAELNWIMFKDTKVRTEIVRSNTQNVVQQAHLAQADAGLNLQPTFRSEYAPPETTPDPATPQIQLLNHDERSNLSNPRYSQLLDQQARLAMNAALLLKEHHPKRTTTPEIAFPLASLMRSHNKDAMADDLLRSLAQKSGSNVSTLARSELWVAAPMGLPIRSLQSMKSTGLRPHLDGMLSDPCWQAMPEMRLSATQRREKDPQETNSSLVLMTYDNEYLYLAASMLKVEALEYAPCQQPGRVHDELLDGHDRLAFHFDVNRDATSAFIFEVDQRGKTRERAWDQIGWDPQWFVAATQDETRWRIEAAIPLNELVPQSPELGATWNLYISRTVPFHQYESWTAPVTAEPTYQNWGMLQFK